VTLKNVSIDDKYELTRGRALLSGVQALARLPMNQKVLRGTLLDIVSYTAERRMERRLAVEYSGMIRELLTQLTTENHAVAVELATAPDRIRGYGHVKERNIRVVALEQAGLLERFRRCGHPSAAAQS